MCGTPMTARLQRFLSEDIQKIRGNATSGVENVALHANRSNLYPRTNILLSICRELAEVEGISLREFATKHGIKLDGVNCPPHFFDTEGVQDLSSGLSQADHLLKGDIEAVTPTVSFHVCSLSVTINDGADTVFATPDVNLVWQFMQYCHRDDVDIVAITDSVNHTGVSLNIEQFLAFAKAHAESGWGEARFTVTPGPMGDEGVMAYRKENSDDQ